MTIANKINLLDIIQEHCNYCPEDLGDVATALLSVQDKLDYNLQYELEYLLSRYVIARAKLDPEGLQSILTKFPNITEETGITESLEYAYNKLNEKIHSICDTSESNSDFDSVKESIGRLAGTSELCLADHSDSSTEDDKSDKDSKLKKKVKGKKEQEDATPNTEKVKESIPQKISVESKEEVILESLDGLEELRLNATVTDSLSNDGSVWNVRLIVEGHTLSGRYFPQDVLREAIPLFEGTRAYYNHPADGYEGEDRPLENLVGWYDGVNLKEGDGLYASWHILANSGKSYLREQLVELKEAGKLDLIGLSLLGLGKNSFKQIDGKLVKYSEAISHVRSVDLVDVPGAGGKILEQIKMSDDNKTRSEIMSLETMTPDELREANPELYEQMLKLSANTPKLDDDSKEDNKLEPKVEVLKETSPSNSDLILEKLLIRESNSTFKDMISESNLPDAIRESLKKKFYGKVFEIDDLEDEIKTYRESVAEFAPYSGSQFHMPSTAYLITDNDRMQAAMDRLFELPLAEGMENTPKLSGIREAYVMITGDSDFSWGAIALDDRFREALPTAAKVVGGGTITFANVLGTSINRRLLNSYKRQVMWWEPFTTVTSLNNLKQQDRNRIESLGSLTERTTGGAEYTELTWAEFVHTFTPTEYGNLVPIAQRAIVDDDLRSLVRASDELGRSAGITLNEYVSNLFTQNSGAGPTFIDVDQSGNTESAAEKLFAGDTTAEHNNLITSNLTRASYKDADTRIRTMGDKSQKRIGLQSANLLIPAELKEMALQIQQSQQVPDSANNAINIFANTFAVIEVPQFTNAARWYLMSSKDQIEMLEMGFLNGRRDPELFVQADPQMGMVFTHDVINYKIRHRYGGGWLDYRGSVASLPS